MRIALIAVGLSAVPAFAQPVLPTTLVKEGDMIGGSAVMFVEQVVANSGTGFAVQLSGADGIDRFWGNVVRGPGAVLRSEGVVVGPLTQGSFESFFGFSASGQIALSATTTGGVLTSADAVWVDDTALAVEGFPVSAIPGQFWRFASRPTITSSGEAWWVGGLTSTQGGSTQGRGLFRGTGVPLFRSGDVLGGVAEPVNANALSFDFGISGDGMNYLATAQLAAFSGEDMVVIRNGSALMIGTDVVREGQIIPVSAGGDGALSWQNFNFLGITNGGRYFLTGDSNDITTADEFIVRDGRIVLRDGMMLDGETLQGDIEMAAMNEQGDLGFIWDVAANVTEAVYLNRRLLIKEGDPADLDNNGTADAGSAIVNFTNIACLGVSGRDGGRVDVYFTADVDTDGMLATTTDVVEGAFRIAVCLPDINRSGASTVQDIFDFLALWFAGDLAADYNNDFAITVQDIFDFLAGWFAGCPS